MLPCNLWSECNCKMFHYCVFRTNVECSMPIATVRSVESFFYCVRCHVLCDGRRWRCTCQNCLISVELVLLCMFQTILLMVTVVDWVVCQFPACEIPKQVTSRKAIKRTFFNISSNLAHFADNFKTDLTWNLLIINVCRTLETFNFSWLCRRKQFVYNSIE